MATLLIAVVVMPLLYFFTAADRQARFTEGFFLAHHRARLVVIQEAWTGREKGFVAGEREIDGPGVQSGLPAGTIHVEEVEDLPGLQAVRATIPWGGAVIGHRKVEHARLVADPRVFLSGRPGKP